MDLLIPVLIGTLLNLAALYIEWRDSKLKYDKLMAQNADLAKRVRKLEYERQYFRKEFTFHGNQIANLEDGLNMHIRVFDHVFEPITPPDVYDVNLNTQRTASRPPADLFR